jgi:hypothetical protein
MLQKIRYGYGMQGHEEKMDILHNWYSDLNAYLPEYLEKAKISEEKVATINSLLIDAQERITTMEGEYQPAFEGVTTCTDAEKKFRATIRGVKETLDQITAISKVIDDQQTTNEEGVSVA